MLFLSTEDHPYEYNFYTVGANNIFTFRSEVVPILPETDHSLPFVLTVRSHYTCNRSINSPLPKRHNNTFAL